MTSAIQRPHHKTQENHMLCIRFLQLSIFEQQTVCELFNTYNILQHSQLFCNMKMFDTHKIYHFQNSRIANTLTVQIV